MILSYPVLFAVGDRVLFVYENEQILPLLHSLFVESLPMLHTPPQTNIEPES